MKRRRETGDSFGMSLADILTTALGCVLLLFMVAVITIKTSLITEQVAHSKTQSELQQESKERAVAEQAQALEKKERLLAERARTLEEARRAAVEPALEMR